MIAANIATATGWSWEYIWEKVTYIQLEAFNRLWEKAPASHVSLAKISAMIAASLGIKNTPRSNGPVGLPEFATLPDIEE